MVGIVDVKFYKSSNSSRGGAITTTQIVSGSSNNLFTNVSQPDLVTGKDYYLCIYLKNTHTTESMVDLSFWLSSASAIGFGDTTTKWARGTSGLNGIEQVVPDINTPPFGISSWNGLASGEPNLPNIGTIAPGKWYPIWIWRHVDAEAIARIDDGPLFTFAFDIPSGGTGTGGSGDGDTGLSLDQFGIKKFFNTKSGALEWYSTAWSNGQVRSFSDNVFDPRDSRFGYTNGDPNTTQLTINGDGTATVTVLNENHRIYVNGPWTNTEISIQIRVRTQNDSVQLRSRSNHHGVQGLPYGVTNNISCGFGNYLTKWGEGGSATTSSEVEVIHDLYARGLNSLPSTVPALNTWTGYKQITRTVGNTVVVTGYINRNITDQTDWVKGTEFTYTGANVTVDPTGHEVNVSTCLNEGDKISGDLNKNTLWLNPGKWAWVRINNAYGVDFQNFTVREIDPVTSSDTGGTGGNPPPAVSDWKMAVAGDWGCGSTTDRVHDLAKTYGFILGVGDNAYASASCWTSTFSDVKAKMNSAYGNHEYSESGGIAPYKTFFGHAKTYFSFNWNNVHVIVIDSNINMDSGSAQNTFVTDDIVAADNNSAIDWIFATDHHPWFGSSSSHSYNNGNVVNAFHSLFTTHKVAFVMTGHNHNWQRSKQVGYNSSSPTNPSVKASTSPYVLSNQGLIHVITGTGGHDSGSGLYSLGSQPSFNAYQNRSNNGIFEIVASNNGKTLTCAFVNTDGNKFDSFVINAT